MAFRLTTFSRPRLTDEAGKTVTLSQKGLLALVYLASAKAGRISRAELATFLWGDCEQSNVFGNLRQLLARIKARQTEDGFELLSMAGTDVVLLDGRLRCDLTELPRDVGDNPEDALRTILSVMGGEFLSGISTGSQAAEFWIESERSRHLSLLMNAISRSVDETEHGASSDLLRRGCLKLIELDPYNTKAHHILINHYYRTGEPSQARVLFGRYQERMRTDLGVEPEAELVTLMRSLLPSRLETRHVENVDAASIAKRNTTSDQNVLPRLLILPPAQLAGQPARLAAALVDDVTIGLCQSRSLAIVAPHTARQIASDPTPAGTSFNRHRISYALETNLHDDGSAMLLFAGLVDVRRDQLLWAERFTIAVDGLGRSYRGLIRNIIAAVNGQIEQHEFANIVFDDGPNAYQHYLLGQHHLRKLDLAHIRRARKSFRSSLHGAPDFSNSLSGLARTEHLEWLVTARGDLDLLASSETHARQAIAADPGNASGYHNLGVTRLYRAEFDESVQAFEEAERRAPSHADLIADYADTLVHASDPELAIEKIKKAIDLNPLCPDVYWWTAAGANYCLGRYETALEHVQKLDDKSGATRLAAACWGMLGDTAQAQRHMRKTMKIYPDFEVDRWLAIMPIKDNSHKELYREGLRRAGFK